MLELLRSTEVGRLAVEAVDSFDVEVRPWQGGKKERFIRIRLHEVTGRRFLKTAQGD